MPMATTNIHIDSLLTQAAAGYHNTAYQARNILSIFPTTKESGKVAKYGMEHYRLDFGPRSMGANAHRVDWQAATPVSFSAQEWTVEKSVDDREKALYDDPFNALVDASQVCADKIWLKMEKIVATLLSTAGNYGATTTGGEWSVAGTPVTNINTAINAIVNRTGVPPSSLYGVCSYKVFRDMARNSEVKNLFLNTVPNAGAIGNLTTTDVAKACGLQDIFCITAVENTAAEGATDSMSNVFGTTKFGVFAKFNGPPSLMAPSFALMMSPQVPGLPGANIAVDQYRDETRRSDIVRATALFDAIVVNKNLGQIIDTIS